jgi:lysophospholipase L1-like esterase
MRQIRQIYQYDSVVGYRFIPNLRARIEHEGGGYLIRTNEAGFQSDREFQSAKDGSLRRVLIFGDSLTAGQGVSNGYRFSDRLEQLVPDLETYNFGLSGSGTDQQYLLYRQYAKDIEHDLLIVAVFVENIRRVASRYRAWRDRDNQPIIYEKPYFELDGDELMLKGVPPRKKPYFPDELDRQQSQFVAATERFPKLKQWLRKARSSPALERALQTGGWKDQALKLMRYQPIKEYDDPNYGPWRVMRAILRTWIQENSQPVLIVPVPLFHHVWGIADPSAYQQRLREAAESAGGVFFDPLYDLQRYSAEDRRALYFQDGHLTRAGHYAMAQSLAKQIRRMIPAAVTTSAR